MKIQQYSIEIVRSVYEVDFDEIESTCSDEAADSADEIIEILEGVDLAPSENMKTKILDFVTSGASQLDLEYDTYVNPGNGNRETTAVYLKRIQGGEQT